MGTRGREIVQLDVAELIEDLNRAYADEWLAAYAYTHMAQVVRGRPAARQLAKELKEAAAQELEHQYELAARITQLGGEPPADPDELVGRSNGGYPTPPADMKDLEAVIRTVIEAERGAITVYNALAQKTLGKDPVTHALIAHILGEEVEHEDEFESLIS